MSAENYLVHKLKSATTIEEKREAIANLNGFFGNDVYQDKIFSMVSDDLAPQSQSDNTAPQYIICAYNALWLLKNVEVHNTKALWIDIAISNGCKDILKSIAIDVILSHPKYYMLLKNLF